MSVQDKSAYYNLAFLREMPHVRQSSPFSTQEHNQS